MHGFVFHPGFYLVSSMFPAALAALLLAPARRGEAGEQHAERRRGGPPAGASRRG